MKCPPTRENKPFALEAAYFCQTFPKPTVSSDFSDCESTSFNSRCPKLKVYRNRWGKGRNEMNVNISYLRIVQDDRQGLKSSVTWVRSQLNTQNFYKRTILKNNKEGKRFLETYIFLKSKTFIICSVEKAVCRCTGPRFSKTNKNQMRSASLSLGLCRTTLVGMLSKEVCTCRVKSRHPSQVEWSPEKVQP